MFVPFINGRVEGPQPGYPLVIELQSTPQACLQCRVRKTSLCNAIPEHQLAHLSGTVMHGIAMPGHDLITQGDAAESFFNVSSGTAKLYKTMPNGRRQITGFVGHGQFLGLAVSEYYAFSAEAIDRVTYCRFSRPWLRALMGEFPQIERHLLAIVSNELLVAQDQMLLLGQKSALEKVASFLVMWSRQGASGQTVQSRFQLPMSRGDIADYLGMKIETVSRSFTVLRDKKVIETTGHHHVSIIKYRALLKIADGEGAIQDM